MQRTRPPWRTLASAVLLSAGIPLLAFTLLLAATGTGGAARAGEEASSTGVRVTLPAVPVAGQKAFSGTLGTARIGATTGRVNADYADDPDGVKDYVTIANPSGGVSGTTDVDAWDATGDPNVFTMRLIPGGREVLEVAAVHTYAQCQPPNAPQVQNFVTAPSVAGNAISEGTTKMRVTGSALGYGGVDHADLTVTMTQVKNTKPTIFAEARVVITIDGELFDGGGASLYTGNLAKVVLGDVYARCEGDPTSPPPTPPGPQPEPGVLKVRKTVDKHIVQVGGTVHYTLTETNTGGTTLPNASFTDDLTDVLRHGEVVDIDATSGKITYAPPTLTWTGRLDPGETAVVTITVKARHIGRMRNVVVWEPTPPPTPKPTPSPTTKPPKPPKPAPKPKKKKDKVVTRVVPRHVK